VPSCFFATDLHGRPDRYRKLFAAVETERPAGLFLGGDLLPPLGGHGDAGDFLGDVFAPALAGVRARLGGRAPRVFLILGNDDPRSEEARLREAERGGLLDYVHGRRVDWEGFSVYGYACVPPTPFLLKDWERYDVSRYVDPGCVPPDEGWRSSPPPDELVPGTIARDLEDLAGSDDLARSIVLFHSPPYGTNLDRAALDGRTVDHAPVDVHVGSIAIRRFIEARQPAVTLHGHVHESARITGAWRDRLGRTHAFSAAHDGPELALVRFDPADPESATRELV
jgi:Icc-related predicted phosphoesterase